jgi:hypothetical protein
MNICHSGTFGKHAHHWGYRWSQFAAPIYPKNYPKIYPTRTAMQVLKI